MRYSVGVFINEESDLPRLSILAEKDICCHLAFMHHKEYIQFRNMVPSNLRITSLHAFNDDRGEPFEEYLAKLTDFRDFFWERNGKNEHDCKEDFIMAVHPNHFGKEFADIKWLYPEVFSYKKKKMLRTPLDILATCGRMTLDTSHLDIDWLSSDKLMRSLIRNTGILHLSQRANESSKSHHKPVSYKGQVPMGLIIRILRDAPVKEIVFEYMPEFFHNVVKDYFSFPKAVRL